MRILTPLILICSLLGNSCILHTHRYLKPERKMCSAIEEYGEKIAAENNLELLLANFDVTDAHTINPEMPVLFCLSYASNKKLHLEEGKTLAKKLIADFLVMLRQCPGAHEIRKLYKIPPDPIDPEKMPIECIGYKISFWDQNMDRIQKPYLAEIVFCLGTIRYYYSDSKTGKMTMCCEEQYEPTVSFS